jgi:hypothetical protein
MTRARLILVLAAAASLAAAGVAAAYLARPDWFVPPPPAVRAPPDPLGRLPPQLVAFLAWPAPDAPQRFIRLNRVKPEAFCRILASVGLKNAAFRTAEPPLRGWTCVTDLIKPVEGDDAAVSSLFVAARGLESDRVDNVRMKLNLIDEATAPVVNAIARDTLFQICRSLGWEPPPAVVEAVETLKEGRILDRGVSYDLRKEFGPALRLNLIVVFPRSLGGGGEDRFVADPQRSPLAR